MDSYEWNRLAEVFGKQGRKFRKSKIYLELGREITIIYGSRTLVVRATGRGLVVDGMKVVRKTKPRTRASINLPPEQVRILDL